MSSWAIAVVALSQKSLFVAHQIWVSVAHGPCATEFTPLKWQFCGAPAHAPQKSAFCGASIPVRHRNLFFVAHSLPCATGFCGAPNPVRHKNIPTCATECFLVFFYFCLSPNTGYIQDLYRKAAHCSTNNTFHMIYEKRHKLY